MAVANPQIRDCARGYVLIALAARMWGTLGFFFRVLHDTFGFSALTVAFLRAGIAALLLAPVAVIARPSQFAVSRRALCFFILYGLIGVAAFYFFYVQAVIQTSVTTAVVLLYTAPAFVTLIAWKAWGEPLTARKLGALALAFSGCVLVARAYDPAELRLNGLGLVLGLGGWLDLRAIHDPLQGGLARAFERDGSYLCPRFWDFS